MRFSHLASALLSVSARWTPIGVEPLGAPCFEACQMTLRPIRFTDPDGGVPRVKQCRSPLAIASLYLCARTYCSVGNREEGLDTQNQTCQASSAPASLPPWGIIANYTGEDVSRMRKFDQQDYEGGMVFAEAVIPSAHFFGLAYNTLDSWSYAFTRHIRYGAAMFVFWGFVVALSLTIRLFGTLSHLHIMKQSGWQHVPVEEPEEGNEAIHKDSTRATRLAVWLKRYLTVPATFGYRASQSFGWYTVPPRIQSLTLLVFVLLNIYFCADGYHAFEGNLYFPKVHTQLWRYLSDRTGIISLANFPLIWLFGMRNNVLIWLTGWNFGTYNNFHRWVARIATLQAVIHSIGYTVLVVDSGGWPLFFHYWEQLWWTTGEIATVFMCALMPLSLYWMRRHVYELFLLLHIVLSFIILVTLWAHVSIFKGHYATLTWMCVAIRVFDRALRILRTLAFNRMFWKTRAQAFYDPGANMIRLSIPCTTSLYQPQPGTFYYIQLLNDLRLWESHPFTMARLQEKHDPEASQAPVEHPIPNDEAASLLPRTNTDDIQLIPGHTHAHSDLVRPYMTFLIRPYDSFTKRLRDAAHASYPQPAYLPMLVEGPYGHTQSLQRFDHILFIVGGSGIVVPLVHLERLLEATSNTKVVNIIWAVREPAFAASVLQQDLGDFHDAFDYGKLSLDVYVTRAQTSQQWQHLPKEARVLPGRPDVDAQVEDAVRAYGRRGTLAVVSCGPARLNDDARRAVVDSLGKGRYAIEYFEESFNW